MTLASTGHHADVEDRFSKLEPVLIFTVSSLERLEVSIAFQKEKKNWLKRKFKIIIDITIKELNEMNFQWFIHYKDH